MRCVPARVFATHDLKVREHEVIKRFRSWDRGEHQREWQALVARHDRPSVLSSQASRLLGLLE